MKKKTVYWTDEWKYSPTSTMLNPPLEQSAIGLMNVSKESEIVKCPAFRDYYKNTLVVKSPNEMTISSNKNGGWHLEVFAPPHKNVNDFFKVRDESLISLSVFHFFWSETPTLIEQLHPIWMDGDVASCTQSVSGTFDISKWIRPLQPSFRLPNPNVVEKIKINVGDPLYIARVASLENIEFRRFSMTQKLENIIVQSLAVSGATSNFFRSIQNYYQVFEQRKLRKLVTDEIKANLY